MNMTTYTFEKRIWKRLGMAGFAFFLLKGLLWLLIPLLIYVFG